MEQTAYTKLIALYESHNYFIDINEHNELFRLIKNNKPLKSYSETKTISDLFLFTIYKFNNMLKCHPKITIEKIFIDKQIVGAITHYYKIMHFDIVDDANKLIIFDNFSQIETFYKPFNELFDIYNKYIIDKKICVESHIKLLRKMENDKMCTDEIYDVGYFRSAQFLEIIKKINKTLKCDQAIHVNRNDYSKMMLSLVAIYYLIMGFNIICNQTHLTIIDNLINAPIANNPYNDLASCSDKLELSNLIKELNKGKTNAAIGYDVFYFRSMRLLRYINSPNNKLAHDDPIMKFL